MTSIHLGISTCPNDTFAFHALMEEDIDREGLRFDLELLDVQELNQRLGQSDFDAAKGSFYAALTMTDQLGVLPSGSALGFGVGPVILSHQDGVTPSTIPEGRRAQVLSPGELTTAHLLYRIFHPADSEIRHVVFSDIMPALQRHEADFGLCIHEGRFTYQAQGLHLVEDLGETWEQTTKAPLPLGGIFARHELGAELHGRIHRALYNSIVFARKHPERALPTMRRYAQEMEDSVIQAHVDLYVNDWTVELGTEGRRALSILEAKAKEAGLLLTESAPLRILGETAGSSDSQ